MIWNYDKFSRQNTKFGKIYALSKNIISPNLIVKKIWHIAKTINTLYNYKKNSLENSFLGKHVFWEKDPKKR